MTDTNTEMTAAQYTEILVAEVIKTEDFKRITGSFIHAMVNNWAGNNGLRKRMAPSIEKRMKNSLAGPDAAKAEEAAVTLRDITALTAPLIALANDMLNRVEQLGETLEGMDEEKMEALIEAIVRDLNFEKAAALSGPIVRAMTRIRQKHPTFLADILRDRLTAIVNELDFNTATAFLAGSRQDLTALARTINDALWQSPERLDQALAVIPATVNLLASVVAEFLRRFSKLKIEDLTDLFLQLIDQIDGEAVGAMLNANAQINRKFMKGTRELRDPKSDIPTSENILMRKIEEIAGNIDPDLIFNLRLNIEDLKVPFREWLMSD